MQRRYSLCLNGLLALLALGLMCYLELYRIDYGAIHAGLAQLPLSQRLVRSPWVGLGKYFVFLALHFCLCRVWDARSKGAGQR